MAENKKSFLLYQTQRPTFEGLSDEDAGKLIKTIFAYVCDENPQPDGIVGYAFNIVKPILKADLRKYEDKRAKLKENISKRWNKNENEEIQMNTNEYNSIQTDGVNVNVNVNDNVNVNKINDKLINHTCVCEDTKNIHNLIKGLYKNKEIELAEALTISKLLFELDSKYEKCDVAKAWLYSWSKSQNSINRVAYLTSILEKNVKNVENIK